MCGPGCPSPTTPFRLVSDPVPDAVDTGVKLAAIHVAGGWVISWMTVEKIVLVGMVSAIYGLFLPTVRRLHAGALRLDRHPGRPQRRHHAALLAPQLVDRVGRPGRPGRIVVNVAMVGLIDFVFGRDGHGWTTFFFLCLISLMTTLHDRYQPIYAWRRAQAVEAADAPAA